MQIPFSQLTTSKAPYKLALFRCTALAAMQGRLCFICHTQPLYRLRSTGGI